MRAGRITLGSALLASLALTACEDEAPVGPPGNQQAREAPRIEEAQDYPDHWWRMYGAYLKHLNDVPGYAGHFYEEGDLVVYLENPGTQEQTARRVLGNVAAQEFGSAPRQMRALKRRYDIIDLIRWHDTIRQLYGRWQISNGLSVKRQRIEVGIMPGDNEDALRSDIEDLGIPLDAISIEVVEPFNPEAQSSAEEVTFQQQPAQTLRDRVGDFNLIPGFKITVLRQARISTACTLGILLETQNVGILAGTAGHCTDYLHLNDSGVQMWQPVLDPADSPVGREIWSPPIRRPNDGGEGEQFCGGGDCIWSDFSLFQLSGVRWGQPGRVAETEGERSIDTQEGRFTRITSIPPDRPVEGVEVTMVGQITGQSSGSVIVPCQDIPFQRNSPAESVEILCQTIATFVVAGGDSGAPVRGRNLDNQDRFFGIVSGRWGINAAFTPTADMITERRHRFLLGELRFCPTCQWIN